MDIFMEYLIKRHKDTKDYILTALIIMGAVVLSVVLLIAMFVLSLSMSSAGQEAGQFSSIVTSLGMLLVAGLWWGTVKLINYRSIEFEYILTNSELDVDKIIAKKGRKRVVSIDFKDIEIMANINDNEHNSEYKNKTENVKVYDVTGNKANGNVYFVDTTIEGENARVLFQPTSKILESVRKFNPRNIFIYEEY